MKDLYDTYEEVCATLGRELADANEKIRANGGKVTSGDVEYLDRLTHAMKSVKTVMAMMDADGYSNAGMPYDGMMADGTRSNARARRDAMGRYSRRGHSHDDGLVRELRELMDDAEDERVRMEFQKFISKVEQMG